MVVYLSCINKVDLSLPFSSVTQKDDFGAVLRFTGYYQLPWFHFPLYCGGLKPHFGKLIFENLMYLKFKFILVILA